jgi:DNA-binding MarR family transcriptional regulator
MEKFNHPTYAPFGYMIHDVGKLIRRRFEEQARQHSLTLPQWRAIGVLSKHEHLSQVALAGMIEADPMTVSGILDRLEAKQLVERFPDPGDNRAKLVRLTDKAHALVGEMRTVGAALFEEAFEGLDEADREALLRILSRITENLKKNLPQKELQS